MDLGLTFDLQTDPHDPRQAEFDPPRVVDALCAALERLGHRVARLGGASDVLSAPERALGVELVFNIAEGAGGRCREAVLPALLERLGVPYVGSGPTALVLALDKAVTKRLAAASDVPTPRWLSVASVDQLPAELPLHWPVIVKPRYEGSGIGIDPEAVVSTPRALADRVARMLAQWRQPVLIEEFVSFGEVTVCLIGNGPPSAYPAIQRPLDPASRLSCHVARRDADWIAPVALTPELDAAVGRMAVEVFDALGCRDMARVDFRIDEGGRPLFLEINPLPTFDPEGSLGLLAEYLGVPFHALLGRIVDAAARRLALPAHRAT
jgi:D-alanine-D-alanine ligase